MRLLPARSRQAWLLATGAGALLVAGALGVGLWKEHRLRQQVDAARAAILAAKDLISEQPPALEHFLASREAGFPVFVKLLREDDPVVWTRTIDVLDYRHEDARKRFGSDWDVPTRFQVHLRTTDLTAWVKYQLPEAHDHATDWRRGGDLLAPDYWSGRPGETLPPDWKVLSFLRRFLQGERDEAFQGGANLLTPYYRHELEGRAVWALRAMLHSGPGAPSLPSEAELPGGKREAFRLLVDAATVHRFPSVRRNALTALATICNPFDEEEPCLGNSDWWDFDRWDLQNAVGPDGEPVGAADDSYHLDHHLELLAHIDSATTLLGFAKLINEPRVREAVSAALGPQRGRWPVPKPAWMPLEMAAARYLGSRDVNERAIAILALVELDGGAAREALAAHERSETHPELRLLARSGLTALGDGEHVPALERELAARLVVRKRDPWSFHDAEVYYGEPRPASKPFCARASDLARHLLLAGSRAALERIISVAEVEDLHVLANHLNDVIDGAAAPFNTLHEKLEAPQRPFRDWWQANGDRLQWDAASRRFTVRPAIAAEE